MKKLPLIEFLKKEEPIIADGGMATSLYDKGFYINRSFEELSLVEPHADFEVSQGFKQAGADLISTNTFNAVLPKLEKHGIQDSLEDILKASVKIAKDVAQDDAYVLGVMGPLGLVLEPLGPLGEEEAYSHFETTAKILDREGIDGFNLVGFHDLNELSIAVKAVKAVSKLPVLAHMGIQENLKTSYGHSLQNFVKRMESLKVDVVGLAGEVGPSGMLSALNVLRPLTELPISLLPNAGMPRYVNDQYIYLCNPDYMGKYAKRFLQAGANIVGGHCGVSDAHIKAVKNSARVASVSEVSQTFINIGSSQSGVDLANGNGQENPVSFAERSKLSAALSRGERVFSVEIVPPKGVDFVKFHEGCEQLQDGGVKFVNIPDGARAVARMSSLALATYVQRHFDIEPIPHLTTRDRNLIGLQSDLLGCHVNHVRNILAVTGDPPKLGNCPGATAVYDVDAIGLTHILSNMNAGLDLGGGSFGKPSTFVKGVALNPTTTNWELEIRRFKYKIEAGADFVITQPIYSIPAYREFFDRLGPIDIPIIMGIWPLVSLRNAEFLNNEVPGVVVPDWALEQMEKAGSNKEEAVKRGVEIAIKTMEEAKGIVSGFQVSAPFNRVDVALEVIHAL
ncbi:MAG: bifunctional homocysteine S-methyltransferase/methylenetetrahydrofolate reductase [Bdellovibrionales bacterium]|nr:bifunctional homocysteine S-methyltransferase/methylenetetrahydrofolate reductase [Bdellovibrionales bacterium]